MFHRIVTQDKADQKKEPHGNVAEEKVVSAAPQNDANTQTSPVNAAAADVNKPVEMRRDDTTQVEAAKVQQAETQNDEINSKEKEAKPMSNETNENQGQRPVDIPGSSPYQRPMSGPAQYGYAGMQSGGMQSQSSGRRLMIGEGITLSGEIEACDHLVVEGTVEAALKGAKVLDIAENGVYYGTVEIENATIAGRFEGDIRVDGRLTVKSTGVITGTITYRELAVESGATLDGKIAPLSGVQQTAKETPAAPAKGRATAKTQEEPKEEQLNFAAGKATANA